MQLLLRVCSCIACMLTCCIYMNCLWLPIWCAWYIAELYIVIETEIVVMVEWLCVVAWLREIVPLWWLWSLVGVVVILMGVTLLSPSLLCWLIIDGGQCDDMMIDDIMACLCSCLVLLRVWWHDDVISRIWEFQQVDSDRLMINSNRWFQLVDESMRDSNRWRKLQPVDEDVISLMTCDTGWTCYHA